MPLSALGYVAVMGVGRPWEVVLEGAPYSCSVWGVGSCSLASREEGVAPSVLGCWQTMANMHSLSRGLVPVAD